MNIEMKSILILLQMQIFVESAAVRDHLIGLYSIPVCAMEASVLFMMIGKIEYSFKKMLLTIFVFRLA